MGIAGTAILSMRTCSIFVLALLVSACSESSPAQSSSSNAANAAGPGSGAGGDASAGAGGATASTGAGAGTSGSGGDGPSVYGFPTAWPDGTACGNEDPIYVHVYADDTFILRQSLCTSFEGPFLYLLFGEDKVLLEDSGDGGIPLAATVSQLIDDWLAARGKSSIELVVAHSHGHGDHVAGDGQLANLPNTTVVGTSSQAVAGFFGISNWPDQIVSYDLGGRVVDVIPIPGHHTTHIALYDRRHDLLLTGDTLYPGRLYISDFGAYKSSIARLVDFVATQPVSWVLGTHIEMTTTPGDDFAFGATQHPNEHPLELTQATLQELHQAVQAMGNSPVYQVHDDFIIVP